MKRNLLFAFLALCCMSASSQIQKVLLPMGQQTFRPWVGKGYYASNEDVFPDDWMMPEFDESEWGDVTGPISNDEGFYAETTLFEDNYAWWVRRHFQLNDASRVQSLSLSFIHDDGCVVYLNGTEIYRADYVVSEPWTRQVDADLSAVLRNGDNVLAVMVDNFGGADAWLDCGLTAEMMEGDETFQEWIEEYKEYEAMYANMTELFSLLMETEDEAEKETVRMQLKSSLYSAKKVAASYSSLQQYIAKVTEYLAANEVEELREKLNAAMKFQPSTLTFEDEEQIAAASDDMMRLLLLCTYRDENVSIDQWQLYNGYYSMEDGFNYEIDKKHHLAEIRGTNKVLDEDTLNIPSVVKIEGEYYLVVSMRDNNREQPNVQTMVLPETMRRLSYRALSEFRNLKSLTMPATMERIEEWGVFYNCTQLSEITMLSDVPPTLDTDLQSLVKVVVPDGAVKAYMTSSRWKDFLIVSEHPFELTINVEQSGDLGYLMLEETDYLPNINKLTLTGTLNDADWNALKALRNLVELDMSEITNTSIPERQFSNATVSHVSLPSGLTELNYGTFSSSRLESVVIPPLVTVIKNDCFEYCRNLKEVTIPEGVEQIYAYAFRGCNLSTLTLPSSLKSIMSYAFASNENLKSVEFAEGLEYIYNNAFEWNTSLEEVTLPGSLKGMDNDVFYGCTSLKSITMHAVLPPSTDGCPVNGIDMQDFILYVPGWSRIEYQSANGWSQFPTIVATDYLPQNIQINRDFSFRLDESEVSGFTPDISLMWDNENTCGNLWIRSSGKLSANHFSMYVSPYAKQYDDSHRYDGWYGETRYKSNSLLVEGAMRAEDVTLSLTCRKDRWQFISFPFDVKMSDIQPVDNTTQWVVRTYSGSNRAAMSGDTWVDLTSEDVLKAGKGYILHCYKEGNWDEPVMFSVKPDVTSASRQNIFLSEDRTCELDEFPSEFVHNQSWNLIGNPYPCYYDTRFMDFTAPFIVWDSYNNRYVAYSPQDDDYVLTPGEAFFLQRPVDQATLTFAAAGRQSTITARDIEAVKKAPSLSKRFVCDLYLKGDSTTDRTRVVFNESASLRYDLSLDANKLTPLLAKSAQLYTVYDGVRYAINERPWADETVELGLYIAEAGMYSFSFGRMDAGKAVLEDRVLGTFTELTAENGYTFNAEAGQMNGRFFLHFQQSATGVDAVNAETTTTADAPVYNLAGQRVGKDAKGIVIQKGKKSLK